MLFDYNNKKNLIGTQKEKELLLVVHNLALKEQIVELSASTTIQGYLKENK